MSYRILFRFSYIADKQFIGHNSSKISEPWGLYSFGNNISKIRNNLFLHGSEFYYKYYLMPRRILLYLMPTTTIVSYRLFIRHIRKSE